MKNAYANPDIFDVPYLDVTLMFHVPESQRHADGPCLIITLRAHQFRCKMRCKMLDQLVLNSDI